MPFIDNIKPQLLVPLPCLADNLPAEILTEVFSNIVTSNSYHYTAEVATQLEKEALVFRRASQVSRFWRDVALHQCKDIWGSIINVDTSSSAWVEELIARSGNSPLTIQSLPYRRGRNEDFYTKKWTSILARMDRVKILHFELRCQEDVSQLMYATSNFHAPILESFRVGFGRRFGSEPSHNFFAFEGPLFDNHCPNLRDLVLTNVAFLQESMDFSTIRLVHLDITPDCLSAPPTVSQWLDVLETQPSLRYLTMDVHATFDAEIRLVFSREVRLPNLQEFNIEAAGIEGANIFASLILPSHCGIAIHIREDDETFDDLSFIETFGESLSRCIKRWSKKGSAPNPELGSWGLEMDELYFVLRLGSKNDEWYNPRIQLRYNALYCGEDDTQDVSPVLSRFISVIPKTGIIDAASSCTLELQHSISKNVGLMALLLQCCSSITHLRLVGESLWFINGLLPEAGSGAVLFPTLNHVTFDRIYIQDSEFDLVYGYFQSFLRSISATGRGIPATTLHIDMTFGMHAKFAEKAISSFGSKVQTFTHKGRFEELWAPKFWVGRDELRIIDS